VEEDDRYGGDGEDGHGAKEEANRTSYGMSEAFGGAINLHHSNARYASSHQPARLRAPNDRAFSRSTTNARQLVRLSGMEEDQSYE